MFYNISKTLFLFSIIFSFNTYALFGPRSPFTQGTRLSTKLTPTQVPFKQRMHKVESITDPLKNAFTEQRLRNVLYKGRLGLYTVGAGYVGYQAWNSPWMRLQRDYASLLQNPTRPLDFAHIAQNYSMKALINKIPDLINDQGPTMVVNELMSFLNNEEVDRQEKRQLVRWTLNHLDTLSESLHDQEGTFWKKYMKIIYDFLYFSYVDGGPLLQLWKTMENKDQAKDLLHTARAIDKQGLKELYAYMLSKSAYSPEQQQTLLHNFDKIKTAAPAEKEQTSFGKWENFKNEVRKHLPTPALRSGEKELQLQ